jgi:hypothetical protein
MALAARLAFSHAIQACKFGCAASCTARLNPTLVSGGRCRRCRPCGNRTCSGEPKCENCLSSLSLKVNAGRITHGLVL